jgi:hypothetical protein
MKRSRLSYLFYVYSELYLAGFCALLAGVELICGLALLALGENLFSYFALGSAALFAVIAALYVIEVYFLEKGNN